MNEPLDTPVFADLLVSGACWLIVASGCWAALIVVAAVLEVLTSGHLSATAWVGCPPALRRALLAGLGIALASAPGSTSAASTAAVSTEGPLPVPARVSGAVRAASPEHLVVRPGDTLWHLAEVQLSTPSSEGDVATLVDRLHRRNHEEIGSDPDLIRPGQRLTVPPLPHQQQQQQQHRREESP